MKGGLLAGVWWGGRSGGVGGWEFLRGSPSEASDRRRELHAVFSKADNTGTAPGTQSCVGPASTPAPTQLNRVGPHVA